MGKQFTLTLRYEVTVEAETEEEAITLAGEQLIEETGHDWNIDEGECALCDGTGEVSTDESDGEGHIMSGVGTQKCVCQTE